MDLTESAKLGEEEGRLVGATLGDEEGAALGEVEGRLVGTALGDEEGKLVEGEALGDADG